MPYRVLADGTLLFLIDGDYHIDYIIDTKDETLYITKKENDENRPTIPTTTE